VTGKRKVFEDALREANNFAWDGQWKKAIAAYQRALEEFPQDASVRGNLAQAFAVAGNLDAALAEYQQLSALTPDEPAPLLRMADICVRRGEAERAAEKFGAVATLAEQAGNPTRAVEVLEHVVKLMPDRVDERERLVLLYPTLDQQNAALEQRLALARLYQRQGQHEKAMAHVLQVLQLSPRSAEARQMLEALRSGVATTIRAPADGRPAPLPAAPQKAEGGDGSSPAVAARQRALAALAEIVFERVEEQADDEAVPAAIAQKRAEERARRGKRDALLGQSIDLQTRGMADDAIADYKKALELGADLPAVHLNLGLLHQEKGRLAPAIEQLTLAAADPDYGMGAHFALGECYRAQGKMDLALKHFIEVLKILDLQSARQEQAGELIQLYETLADGYLAEGSQEKSMLFLSSLVDFLSSKGWEDKVRQARGRLESLNQAGFTTSLAEILEAPDAEAVLSSLGMVQEYTRRKLYLTAGEECYAAIALAPGYLPLHLRLAEILMAQERIDEAIAKYTVIAGTYLARGQARQAQGVYRQILGLTPMDVAVRSRLIDLLVASDDVDQTLEEYLALADTFYRMAQVDMAVEAYNQALRLAPRASARESAEARILHLLGDIHLQSVDWAKARKAYQRIVALRPADVAARLNLIDLSFKMGERQAGLAHLDEMIRNYRGQGSTQELLSLLRDLVQTQPNDTEIRSRLAQAYQDLSMRAEAVAELNAMGELQLDAGRYKEAAETVRRLTILEPEKAGDYETLLNQIFSRVGRGG